MDIRKITRSILSASIFAIACLVIANPLRAQSPAPSPSSSEEAEKPYKITSSVELGVRGLDVNGDHDKYRSDLNYKPGLRIFDSSFLIEDHTAGMKLFDTALMTSSGWGSDPSGSFRFNMDKTGIYKFESNIRRVKYFSALNKHALGEHDYNTRHHFGDFDLTIFPERDLRFRVGYSFNNTQGPGTNTVRFPSFSGTTTVRGDEFQVGSNLKTRSDDIRLGVEGKVLGFNLGLNYGHRSFSDKTSFFFNGFSLGNDPSSINTSASLNTLQRVYPTKGRTDYFNFFVQRTFAQRLDFAGRFVYSESKSRFDQADTITGTGNPVSIGGVQTPLTVLLDQITVTGDAKRPQARGDIGMTWRVTDDFRISNTFTFDQYSIGGGNSFFELLKTRTFAGVNRADDFASTTAWRSTNYRRFSNLIEADYQYRRWLAFNLGYRFTHREVAVGDLDINLRSTTVPAAGGEEFSNTTHTIIAGTRVKPTKNWSIFADVERGSSDNVFTRLANNDFINFRIRSKATVKQFSANVSFITKNNDSPGRTCTPLTCPGSPTTVPEFEATAFQRSRYFSASIDWNPHAEYSISGGYTYNFQNSMVDIVVPVGAPIFPSTRFLQGVSEYYVRDSYFHIDVSARPTRWLSAYVSYRIDDDKGQGDRVHTRPQDVITSFPIRYQTPEVRLAFRITKNIDWNVGYQYYDYKERPVDLSFLHQPFVAQNYSAHMPYTSLRFHWGGAEER